jgi:hypothetical protein
MRNLLVRTRRRGNILDEDDVEALHGGLYQYMLFLSLSHARN